MGLISCMNRVCIVRRDLNARGGVVDSQLVQAFSTTETPLADIEAHAADLETEAEPVAGAVVVEIEVVPL